MHGMSAQHLHLSVAVIGDEAVQPADLIKKFTSATDAARTITFGDSHIDMHFTPLDMNKDEPIHEFDVTIFYYNTNEKASYEKMSDYVKKNSLKGMIVLVGSSHGEASADNQFVRAGENLGYTLSQVHPLTYVGAYFDADNAHINNSLGQLILNQIADKALKLKPVKPLIKPVLKRAPITIKPTIAISGLVLGEEGVGKTSVLNQMTEPGDYTDELGYSHKFIELPDCSVRLQLTSAVDVDEEDEAKNYHIGLFCFDLTNFTSMEVLLDKIKLLIANNPDITFALLGNKRDLISKEALGIEKIKSIENTLETIIECLSELYPYSFMGVYLNSTQDKQYYQAPSLVNILVHRYLDKKENEKALIDQFMETHEYRMACDKNKLFSPRTSVTAQDRENFFNIVRKASRKNKRSCRVFESLGWLKEGEVCETTPLAIRLARKTMDMAGVNYEQKLVVRRP